MLKHIASTGARLLELGEAHGLRSVSARSGDEFMILQIAPDGEAVIGGPQLDLAVDRLMILASGQVKELGETHGLRGLYLRNGPEFQVLYATPDGKATIAGVMWDATGKNLTREQVSKIDGTIPTVVVDKDGARQFEAAAKANALVEVEHASFGVFGNPAAPRVWMIFDPYCNYSVRAFNDLKPYVAAGRVQLALVPIAILDYETRGQSTPAAESLLSQDPGHIGEAWERGDFGRSRRRKRWRFWRRTTRSPRTSGSRGRRRSYGARRMGRRGRSTGSEELGGADRRGRGRARCIGEVTIGGAGRAGRVFFGVCARSFGQAVMWDWREPHATAFLHGQRRRAFEEALAARQGATARNARIFLTLGVYAHS